MVDLKILMKNRGKKVETKGTRTSQPAANLPPPPPQIPLDLGTKQVPNLKKKRPIVVTEEREVAPPRRTKQQKVTKGHRDKRAFSTESREDVHVAEIYVAEEWSKKAHLEAQVAAQSQSKAERSLGSLKENYSLLSEQLKEMTNQRNSLDVGLKNVEAQAEDQRKRLHMAEINLATKRELVKGLKAELQKAKESLPEASEQSLVGQLPPASLKVSKESGQPDDPNKPVEAPQDKGKVLAEKKKTLPESKDQDADPSVSQKKA
nr:involucrin-like [Quercus suber]